MEQDDLNLTDTPIDYKLLVEGDYYREPNIPNDKPTYQYAVVPHNYNFRPNISYVILSNLYLPYEDGQTTNSWLESEASSALEERLLTRTNNLVPEDTTITNGRRPSRYNPQGKIAYYDNFLNSNQPVKRAIVRVHRWFTFKWTTTQDDGSFYFDRKFRYAVRYKITFEGKNFTIREGFLNGADIRGPFKRGSWDKTITDIEETSYALAHNAATDYYEIYSPQFGVNNPPERAELAGRRLKIICKEWYHTSVNAECLLGTGSNIYCLGGLLCSDIRLFKPNRKSIEYYGTAIHELAHAAHFAAISNSLWNGTNDQLAESWAEGVKWQFTKERYGNFGDDDLLYVDNFQRRNNQRSRDKTYTSMIVDMIDGDKANLENQYENNTTYPNDKVYGYNLAQLEQCLKQSQNLAQFRDKMRELYPNNNTNVHLDLYFNHWLP